MYRANQPNQAAAGKYAAAWKTRRDQVKKKRALSNADERGKERHTGGGGTFTKAKNAKHEGSYGKPHALPPNFSHTGGGGGAEKLSRAAWRKAHPVMSAAEDKQGLKGTGAGNFSKGGKNYRWSKAAKAFTAQGRSGGGGKFAKNNAQADTNRPRFGRPTGGGVLNMDPRKRPVSPDANWRSVNQDFHAEQNSLREHKPAHYSPEKPTRYRNAGGGKFRKQTAAQIRKFRPSRKLKIHRNPNGMVR